MYQKYIFCELSQMNRYPTFPGLSPFSLKVVISLPLEEISNHIIYSSSYSIIRIPMIQYQKCSAEIRILSFFTCRVPYVTTDTVCPRSSDPFYIESYNIKWVTTTLTYSI